MEIIFGTDPSNYKKASVKYLPTEQEIAHFQDMMNRFADYREKNIGDEAARVYDQMHELFTDVIRRCTDMPEEDIKQLAPESANDIWRQLWLMVEKRKSGDLNE